ncbi:WD40-repeat-containing domain protein [Halteromyces radiatus]|uniref:WD40-repeat-containing domain protein n=1 Tax=Halteromyces radiatus TaxID=101107 RepID=UPI00221F6675|nr:WD40-repeat-containing domain protein [Halteromyces radiatus]KAI8089838.1 WD40-repeat-containing domain protein [Halteromyces radiatus]
MHNTATSIPCKKARSNWVGSSSLMDICGPEDISPPATPPSFNFIGPSSQRTPTPQRPRLFDTRTTTSTTTSSASSTSSSSSSDHLSQFANTCNDAQLEHIHQLKTSFQQLDPQQKQFFLYEIINCCNSTQLTYLNNLIAPRLKIDFMKELPIEISLHVLSFIDDPKTLARAACVSTFWNSLLRDEATWKSLCMKHQYQRRNSNICGGELLAPPTQRLNFSYRQYFKRKYNIAATWAHGGRVKIVDDVFVGNALVTSLQFDNKYIVVGCDNHRIEVFDTQTARKVRTLEGHEGGVWALQFKGGDKYDPERTLVSGGCDRDVRVWDLDTGRLRHVLRGHTSTVRCLKMKDKRTAVTGSRDMTIRIWDIERGILLHVLLGHQHSVRCLEIHGNTVVSGSYDATARIWDIRTGRCLHVLDGHQSQIYAIVFDGHKVVTGSLDYTIKVWSAETGQCLATLQGHTSLVGQLQLTGSTLVSGGSDGCLRVWDLQHYECIQQISAHDNSVTCLQFDDRRMLSAGNDGRVKLWDIKLGRLIRNFSTPGKTVWKLQFNDTKAVVLKQREHPELHTVMEVHDFDVIDDDDDDNNNNNNKDQGGSDNIDNNQVYDHDGTVTTATSSNSMMMDMD